ncbi:MAG: phosphate ABC transporter permease PstA [candidate division WOR-3 bacterium]|uniref:Phosphate transport system permease protein PstA n=1 Tax=candidate division WOR-3 bacterium TaxID=2052148 RepID=A0A7C3EHM1_UNCW3|nr:phosphate ABC transporter permease PstA [candidate division WOR-3 bacterium]
MISRPLVVQRVVWLVLAVLTLFTLAILIFILAFISARGARVITPEFLFSLPERMGKEGGILPTLIATIYIAVVAIVVATPFGVGTAVYLTEYTRESALTRIIRFGADALAGVPSIIFGLFGFILFVIRLKMGWSILAGGLTLAVMILPTIIRTSEEAIRAIPYQLREVSYSLGGTRSQTIMRVVLPNALPGILTGVILGLGRSVAETAAVIFTAGSSLRIPRTILDPGRTMAVHFYILAREGLSMERAYGTAFLLIVVILLINTVAYLLMFRLTRRLK